MNHGIQRMFGIGALLGVMPSATLVQHASAAAEQKLDPALERITDNVTRFKLETDATVAEMKRETEKARKEFADLASVVSDAAQAKIAKYVEQLETTNKNLSTFEIRLNELGSRLKNREKPSEVVADLETLNTEVTGEKVQLGRLAAAPQEFKVFTRLTFKAINGAKDFQVTLTAESAGKKLPLSNRPVNMSRQFLDGNPKPLETLTTDENGQVVISRQGWRSVPKGHNLRFDFDGDKQYRKSFYKATYR